MWPLYSLLLSASLLVLLPVHFVRLRLLRGVPLRLGERLGARLPPPPEAGRPFLWIHAVSVGEVLSLRRLVASVRERHPDWAIGFSSLTESGHRLAGERLAGVDRLFFVPFDLALSVRRVLRRFRPGLLVLAESELWPRLLREASRSGCRILLVNGRISERSFRRYARLRPVARRLLGRVDRFLVQTGTDRDRLLGLGLPPEKIEVSGNLKCEVRLPDLSPGEERRLRSDLGLPSGATVFTAGSIHKGEEGPLLEAFAAARRARPGIRLILAPRHPDKFQDLEKAFGGLGLSFARRTKGPAARAWDVLVLDTLGELASCYAISDAAFIGGSLVPWGGQNLLEPAYYAKAVYFGPHMKNFADLADAFLAAGGARLVRGRADLEAMFASPDDEARAAMGRRAKTALESLSGATEATVAAIEALMPR